MRDPQRIERILALVREIWYLTPDVRLTQLIMNSLGLNSDPYYIEDTELEAKLKGYRDRLKESISKNI
jgi:hypothetical protein